MGFKALLLGVSLILGMASVVVSPRVVCAQEESDAVGEERWVAAGVDVASLPASLDRQWVVLASLGEEARELRLSWFVRKGRVVAVQVSPLEKPRKRGEPVLSVSPLPNGAVLVRLGWRAGRKKVRWAQEAGWRLDEETFDPYARFRDGARFVSDELGLSWRCDASAVKLCRKVLMPLSYPQLGGRLVVSLWSGIADEAQAKRALVERARAQGAEGARLGKKLKGKRGVWELGWKVKAEGKGRAQRWLQGRRVGQRWVLCQLEQQPKSKITLKQARALCASLEEASGFEGRLDCLASADACARACEGGQGWACEALGGAERLEQGCKLGWAPACLRWGQGAGGQAALARACVLGSVRGCVQASYRWPWSRAQGVLAQGCEAEDVRACSALVERCREQPSCALREQQRWSRRACLLGAIQWCEPE